MLRKLVAALFLSFFSFGCSSIQLHVEQEPTQIQRFVHLDPQFSAYEKSIIKSSFTEWNQKTNGNLNWQYQDWLPIVNKTFYLNENKKICFKHILVEKNISTDDMVSSIKRKVGKGISGYTVFSKNPCGADLIILVMDKIHNDKQLKLVTLHEIGHHLHFNHNTKKSIMNDHILWSLNGLTRYDIDSYCMKWNCLI